MRSVEDLADALYTKGYKEGGVKDWDPRGCREWQDVVDAYNSKSPDAWQLVPKEPTEEMLDAACSTNGTSVERYKAMLAAAPKFGEEK